MRTEITPVTIAVTCPFTKGSAVIGLIGASIGCPMFDAFMSCFITSSSSSRFAFVFVFPAARCFTRFSRPRPPRIIIIVVVVVKTCRDDLDDDDEDECDDDRLRLIRVAHALKLVVIVTVISSLFLSSFPQTCSNSPQNLSRVRARKESRFASCRTEKAWETGPTEEILFIAEEDSEENHGCAFLFAFLHIVIISRQKTRILVSREKEINFLSFSLALFPSFPRGAFP
jgi:hypothetical protein